MHQNDTSLILDVFYFGRRVAGARNVSTGGGASVLRLVGQFVNSRVTPAVRGYLDWLFFVYSGGRGNPERAVSRVPRRSGEP